ncbi:hypothetical protein H8356DRAFT_1331497 [Neocallimastix lanati (nom. inval.)]|nr:hypothetical protein H8356DRAFT_1331497 [Neocallimastix sp. JGI-2020a]
MYIMALLLAAMTSRITGSPISLKRISLSLDYLPNPFSVDADFFLSKINILKTFPIHRFIGSIALYTINYIGKTLWEDNSSYRCRKIAIPSKNNVEEGQLINIVSSNSCLHDLWSGPLQLTIILTLLICTLRNEFNFTPVLVRSLSFIAYVTAGNKLTAFPLNLLPMISSDLANSFIVILKFINNIINGKEIDDLTTIDPKTKYALSIKIASNDNDDDGFSITSINLN